MSDWLNEYLKMNHARIVLVGSLGLTHLAQSFYNASLKLGLPVCVVENHTASSRFRIVNSLAWRLLDKRPPYIARFSDALLATLGAIERKAILITTGISPVRVDVIEEARRNGVICIHFSSDDPWNPKQCARWLHKALPHYHIVFTPRRSNIQDFLGLGCADVRYLPFGYDPIIFPGEGGLPWLGPAPDTLFVGGADGDRAAFFRHFRAAGAQVSLVGGAWERYHDLRGAWLGHLPPSEIQALTKATAVNLVLVRRANRDGHVMRSFEAGAIGGCLAVEYTEEHCAIFGSEGDTVRYFSTPKEAAALCQALIADPMERRRLSLAVKEKIRSGGHAYSDRLHTILKAAQEVHQQEAAGTSPTNG